MRIMLTHTELNWPGTNKQAVSVVCWPVPESVYKHWYCPSSLPTTLNTSSLLPLPPYLGVPILIGWVGLRRCQVTAPLPIWQNTCAVSFWLPRYSAESVCVDKNISYHLGTINTLIWWQKFTVVGPNCQQEHIEPAREHVTTIDSEIQTWLLDTKFSNIQIWKGSNMHTCIRMVPRHSPRVNHGFNPIQQQLSHHSRQQRATHPCVLFFWTKKHLDLLGEKLGASISIRSFTVLSFEAIHCFLLCVSLP